MIGSAWDCSFGSYIMSLQPNYGCCVECDFTQNCSFLIFWKLRNSMAVQGIRTFNEDLISSVFLLQISTLKCFCHQLLSILGHRNAWGLCEAHNARFGLHDDFTGRMFLQQEGSYQWVGGKAIFLPFTNQLCFKSVFWGLIGAFRTADAILFVKSWISHVSAFSCIMLVSQAS